MGGELIDQIEREYEDFLGVDSGLLCVECIRAPEYSLTINREMVMSFA